MKLVKVGARGAKAEGLLRNWRARGGVDDAVLPAVRKIVDGVRAAAMRRCGGMPRSLMACRRKSELRISREEMQRAWEETPGELQNALRSAAKNIRAFAERSFRAGVEFFAGAGAGDGAGDSGSGFVWMLCAERAISAAFDAADDGDSGAGGGRKEDCGGVSEAGTGDAGRRMDAGC